MYRNHRRSDMAEGWNERVGREYTKYAWNFKRDKNPGIEPRVKKFPKLKVFI